MTNDRVARHLFSANGKPGNLNRYCHPSALLTPRILNGISADKLSICFHVERSERPHSVPNCIRYLRRAILFLAFNMQSLLEKRRFKGEGEGVASSYLPNDLSFFKAGNILSSLLRSSIDCKSKLI